MNNRIKSLFVFATIMVSGCTHYVSSIPTSTAVNGDAWYTSRKMFKSKVWYCPAPSAGPATCTEAKLVDDK